MTITKIFKGAAHGVAAFSLCILSFGSNAEPPTGLKQWSPPDEVNLSSAGKRKVLGTWYSRTLKCTRSIEQVGSNYFEVKRYSDGAGEGAGTPLIKFGDSKYKPKSGSRFGDYFVIEKDGRLGIYDKDGQVDILPTANSLFPSKTEIATANNSVKKPDVSEDKDRLIKIKAQFSSWDGAHRNLEKLIKEGMHDPGSYEHISTQYTDMGRYLVVKTIFRGKNGFGALIKNTITARVSLSGEVQAVISQE